MKMNWFFAFIIGCVVLLFVFPFTVYFNEKWKSAARAEEIEKIQMEYLEKRVERLENILIENQE